MDITQFNKELAIRIATAKRFEKNGDFKSAIKLWLEISEMTIRLSKNQKLDASFRNMLMNRTRGIFEHIKNLKSEQFKEEIYVENIATPQDTAQEVVIPDKSNDLQGSDISETKVSKVKIIEDSDLKILPKGFKEIETSEDFEIITPHDKDFVKKQLDKALDSDFKANKQEKSEEFLKPQDRLDFEQLKGGKNKICFACGYDKNLSTDKICKNCGTNLN